MSGVAAQPQRLTVRCASGQRAHGDDAAGTRLGWIQRLRIHGTRAEQHNNHDQSPEHLYSCSSNALRAGQQNRRFSETEAGIAAFSDFCTFRPVPLADIRHKHARFSGNVRA